MADRPTPQRVRDGTREWWSTGWHVIRWIEEWCTFTNGRWLGQPFRLMPWQKRLLHELFEVDRDGRRVYRMALIGIPRKSGKTELAAAIAAYLAWADGGVTGCKGANGATSGSGGGGGSGIGGGGRGSNISVETGPGGQGGNGGRGGGVVVIFAKKVNNAGRISADGEAGLPGTGTNAGGGGGGGGGAAVLVYEQVEGSGAGLVRALPGNGGASVGVCSGSSAGGTGLALELRIRSGW